MLSDRPYMRDDYPRERTAVHIWLICGIVACLVIQCVLGSPWIRGTAALDRFVALSIPGLRSGYVWTLVTHGFLHDPADSNFLFNLLLDVMGLYFLGRELLPLLGPGKFLGLFAGALVTGGLAWAAVHWRQAGFQYHIGATAAIDALLVVFACFYPDKKIDFLLFFIFPVSVKPKHLALGLAGFDLFGLLFYEIPGASLPFGMVIANSAHLGGMAAGWLYYRYFHDAGWLSFKPKADIELPRWMKRKSKVVVTPTAYQVNLTSRRDLRAEVDRILDKINSDGFGSLSPGEKRLLDEAKDLLSRR